MRIVFMGSAGFACPCLKALLDSPADDVVAVVTQPDRPKGRHLAVSPCPVKAYVGERSIPVLTPENINTPESLETLRSLRPELIVVVAYGQLLKRALLDIPPFGCINVHGSLLPRYRGAAPIQWAVAEGGAVSGVTTMFLSARMDAGDMILKQEVPIASGDTGGSYHDKLAVAGASLLRETVDRIRLGQAPRIAQDESQATHAPKLKKIDGQIDWMRPAAMIECRVRAFTPWPGSFCILPGPCHSHLKVIEVRVEPGRDVPAGMVCEVGEAGPLIQTGDGHAIRLLMVQPEGRKPMKGSDFLHGHHVRAGDRMG